MSASTLLSEELISLNEAAKRLPALHGNNHKAHITIWRWVRQGLKLPDGETVRLEAVRIGHHWITSVEALERFADLQTAAYLPHAAAPRDSKRSSRKIQRSKRQLQTAGA